MPDGFADFVILAAAPAESAPGGSTGQTGQPATDTPQGGGLLGQLPLFALIFFIIWFVVIRPQSKERKKREQDLKAVRKYDKVITNAGIHGTVMSVGDTDLTLRIDDKNDVRVKIEKTALWQIKPTDAGTPSADSEEIPESEEKAAEKGKA